MRCESGGVWEGLEARALTSIAGQLLIQTLISDRFEAIGHVLMLHCWSQTLEYTSSLSPLLKASPGEGED